MTREASRLKLHSKLVEILGSQYVYYQSPESVKMHYPCIRYNLDYMYNEYANDRNYVNEERYMVTYISKDPDDELPAALIGEFSKCSFDRFYTADNMNHWVFTLYFK